MMNILGTIVAVGAIAVMPVAASAATVVFGDFPDAAIMNPEADSTTGTVYENFTGSVSGIRRSPWQGSAIDENAASSYYTSVSAGSTATYVFGRLVPGISFLWGSPDSYNDLDIILSGGGATNTVNGAQAQGPVAIGAQFVTIWGDVAFDTVTFRSGQNAFEFANLQAVPLPAAGWMLLAGVGGLAAMKRRRKSA